MNNPYDVFGGAFVPHFVLSSRRISPGAKILYALLAKNADIRGESLLNPSLRAVEMGVEPEVVLKLADELGKACLVKVRQDPAGTEFLRCHFPRDAWQKDASRRDEEDDETMTTSTSPRLLKLSVSPAEDGAPADNSSPSEHKLQPEKAKQDVDGEQSTKKPASRFSREVCIEYAKARRRAEGKIDNPYALGTAMSKTTEYDEEIMLWLQRKESNESAA